MNYDELTCSRCGRKIAVVGGFQYRELKDGSVLLLCKDCAAMVADPERFVSARRCPVYVGAAARFIISVARRMAACRSIICA